MRRHRLLLSLAPAVLLAMLVSLHAARGPSEASREADPPLETGAAALSAPAVVEPAVPKTATHAMAAQVPPGFPIVEVVESGPPLDMGEPLLVEEMPWMPTPEIIEIGEPLDALDGTAELHGALGSTPMTIGVVLDADDPFAHHAPLNQSPRVLLGESLDADAPGRADAVEPPPVDLGASMQAVPWP